MDYKILKISIADRIATVTISRPAVLNALNTEFFRETDHFLHDLQARDDVRVLVITGEGKAFVAGADISELNKLNMIAAKEYSEKGQAVFNRIKNMNAQAIAAQNHLLGYEITVSGLLCGKDIIRAVIESGIQADIVVVPETAFNTDGVMLDDMKLTEMAKALKSKVITSDKLVSITEYIPMI